MAIFFVINILFPYFSNAQVNDYYVLRNNPHDVDEAIAYLKATMADSTKEKIGKMTEKEFIESKYLGLSVELEKRWKLNKKPKYILWFTSREPPMVKYFRFLKIYYPDHMSAIILIAYYRKITGKNINLCELIDYFKQYEHVIIFS